MRMRQEDLPWQELLLWKRDFATAPHELPEHCKSFPGLGDLSVLPHHDESTDTVLLRLRFLGSEEDRTAVTRWARTAGFTLIGESWRHDKKGRFDREVNRFRTRRVRAAGGLLAAFCLELESISAHRARRYNLPEPPRRFPRSTRNSQYEGGRSLALADTAPLPILRPDTGADELSVSYDESPSILDRIRSRKR